MSSLDDYVNSIKTAIVTLGQEAIFNWIASYVPFLRWPIISFVVKAGIKKLLSDVTDGGEFLAFAKYIDVRTTAQGKDFAAAAFANYNAQLTGTQWEKDRAEKELRLRFASFAKLTS